MAQAAAGIVLAYLVGSIPSAYVAVRLLRGMDVRAVGSRNVGTLNAWKQLGAPAGIGVLAADVGKGAVGYLLPLWLGAGDWAATLGGLAALAGHNWPVFLGFRGGKGAATTLGVGLAMSPLLALAGAATSLALLGATRHVLFSGFVGYIAFGVLVVATHQEGPVVVAAFLLPGLVVATNLLRSPWPIVNALRQRRWRDVLFPR